MSQMDYSLRGFGKTKINFVENFENKFSVYRASLMLFRLTKLFLTAIKNVGDRERLWVPKWMTHSRLSFNWNLASFIYFFKLTHDKPIYGCASRSPRKVSYSLYSDVVCVVVCVFLQRFTAIWPFSRNLNCSGNFVKHTQRNSIAADCWNLPQIRLTDWNHNVTTMGHD